MNFWCQNSRSRLISIDDKCVKRNTRFIVVQCSANLKATSLILRNSINLNSFQVQGQN